MAINSSNALAAGILAILGEDPSGAQAPSDAQVRRIAELASSRVLSASAAASQIVALEVSAPPLGHADVVQTRIADLEQRQMTDDSLSDTKAAEADKRAADLQRRVDELSTSLNSALLERAELESARDIALETLRTKEAKMERQTTAAARNGREQIEGQLRAQHERAELNLRKQIAMLQSRVDSALADAHGLI